MSEEDLGYVYVGSSKNLLAHHPKIYKIGRTEESVHKRFASLNVSICLPDDRLIPMFKWLVKDYCKVEKNLHKKFQDRRVNGEFFTLTDEVLFDLILDMNALEAKATNETTDKCREMDEVISILSRLSDELRDLRYNRYSGLIQWNTGARTRDAMLVENFVRVAL